ncbi:MAG: hypothetical protein ABJA67_05335 [Chthonomonadales bacterium]
MKTLFLAFALVRMSSAAFAVEDSKPEIKSATPFVLFVGEKTKVTIFGDNLNPTEVMCSNPKVTVKMLGAKATEGMDKPKGGRVVELELTSPSDLGPDTLELSLKNMTGEPAKRKFALIQHVGTEVPLKKPSGRFQDAMAITAPITVVGNLADGQPAVLKFEAKAGERFKLSGLAGRSGSTLDMILRVLNSRHITLAIDAGNMKTDRVVDFKAPSTGWFYIEITSEEMKGDPKNDFRLTIQRINN